ncbi:MAG: RHS repeat-associated core domain-containing protein [Zavarzinella sp.]
MKYPTFSDILFLAILRHGAHMSHHVHYRLEHQSGLVDYEFTYDGANRVTSESRGTYVKNYDYDRTSQVVDDGLSSYSYDANGNRTMAGYSVGSNNRTSTDGTWDYTYNDEGSIVKKENISTGLTWTYGFNHRNQMVWAEERATDGGTLLTRVDYTIDAFGNLVQQETDTGSVSTERFAFEIVDTSPGITHSVHRRWADLDGSNAIITRYLDGLARSDGTDLEWLLTDRLGSITEILDDTGAIVKELEWDAFGNIVSQSGSAALGNIGFTGMYFDAATGLGFTKYRAYNFDLGQFIGEDPIGFDAGDANLRRYVGNNGLNGTDLTGLIVDVVKLQESLGLLIFDLIDAEDSDSNMVRIGLINVQINTILDQLVFEWERLLNQPFKQQINRPLPDFSKPQKNNRQILWYVYELSKMNRGPLNLNPVDIVNSNTLSEIDKNFGELGNPSFKVRESAQTALEEMLLWIYVQNPMEFYALINKYLQDEDAEISTRTSRIPNNVIGRFHDIYDIEFQEKGWNFSLINGSILNISNKEKINRYKQLLVKTVKDRRVVRADKHILIVQLRYGFSYPVETLSEYLKD